MSKLDFIKICFSQPTSSSSYSFDLKFSLQPRFHDNQSGSQSPKSNHVLSLDPHETLFIKMYSVRSTMKEWINNEAGGVKFQQVFLIRALRFYFTVNALPCCCIVSVQQSSSSSRCISYSPSRCSTLSLTSHSHLSLSHSRQFKTLFAKSCAERDREREPEKQQTTRFVYFNTRTLQFHPCFRLCSKDFKSE